MLIEPVRPGLYRTRGGSIAEVLKVVKTKHVPDGAVAICVIEYDWATPTVNSWRTNGAFYLLEEKESNLDLVERLEPATPTIDTLPNFKTPESLHD